MKHRISIDGGTSVRLPTAGKYCDRDIVITATGGGGGEVNMNNCTVVTDVPSKTNYYICGETVSGGAITYNITKHYTDANITKSVRCDSVMNIVAGTIKGAVVTDGEVLRVVSGQGLVYKTPSTSGVTAQITLSS